MSLLLLFIYLFILDLDFFKKDFTTFHVGACPIRPFKRQRNVMKFTQNLMKSREITLRIWTREITLRTWTLIFCCNDIITKPLLNL
jgi:hypothetical protein